MAAYDRNITEERFDYYINQNIYHVIFTAEGKSFAVSYNVRKKTHVYEASNKGSKLTSRNHTEAIEFYNKTITD